LQRLLTSATLVALLVATAAAFAITERLKLTKSALMPGTKISKAFSPLCGCQRGRANVRIVLRRPDTVTVAIVNSHRSEVATLAADEAHRRGEAKFQWDGRTDARTLAPDGSYRVRVHLASRHQTIVLPNVIRLDTHPPSFVDLTQNRDAFSPDGDRQADFLRLSYTLTKPAHIALYLGGRRILYTYRHPQRGSLTWKGTAHGHVLRPGQYTLEVGAVDLAGNRMPVEARARVHVRIRFIALASRRLVVRAGKPFEIGVSTDALRYHWKLGKRTGRNGGGVLRLRAPDRPGTYTLTVSERGHADRARVQVRK
jgi:flagellar hook capping protein FlgD